MAGETAVKANLITTKTRAISCKSSSQGDVRDKTMADICILVALSCMAAYCANNVVYTCS